MTEFNDGGYLPSSGRWSKPVVNAGAEPEIVQSQRCAESGCKPEAFEGELVHWSTCPENEGGCKDGTCSL